MTSWHEIEEGKSRKRAADRGRKEQQDNKETTNEQGGIKGGEQSVRWQIGWRDIRRTEPVVLTFPTYPIALTLGRHVVFCCFTTGDLFLFRFYLLCDACCLYSYLRRKRVLLSRLFSLRCFMYQY